MTLIYDPGSYHGEQTGRQKKKLRNYIIIFQVSMDAEMAGEMEELGRELEEQREEQEETEEDRIYRRDSARLCGN